MHAFLSSAGLFQKLTFFSEYHQCQKVWIQVEPDLGSNCLKRLPADDKSCQLTFSSELANAC